MKDKITIYTNGTCGYCKSLKEELSEKNIKFSEKLTKDYVEKWQNITDLTGMPTVPTIEYNNEYFVPGRDFTNADHLIEILKNYRNSPYSQSRKTLERLKTLNYNISTAFQRTDQLLRQIEKNYRELFEN